MSDDVENPYASPRSRGPSSERAERPEDIDVRIDPFGGLPGLTLTWRVAIAIGACAVFVAAVYPRLSYFEPGSNVLAGPLWGVAFSGGPAGLAISLMVTLPLLAAMASPIVWPRWYTVGLAVLGFAGWVGIASWAAGVVSC